MAGTNLPLPAGEYTYDLVDDGISTTDPNVATLAMRDGQEVTWVYVDDCSVPMLQVASGVGSATGAASIDVGFLASSSGQPLDPASLSPRSTATERRSPRAIPREPGGRHHLHPVRPASPSASTRSR